MPISPEPVRTRSPVLTSAYTFFLLMVIIMHVVFIVEKKVMDRIKALKLMVEGLNAKADKMDRELHVFDFDETLTIAPDASFKLYVGHQDGNKFITCDPDRAGEAARIMTSHGISPRSVDGSCIDLDQYGYINARNVMTKEWRNQHFSSLKDDTYGDPTIRWNFPIAEEVPVESYVPILGTDILREKLGQGHYVYICTAREGEANRQNVYEYLEYIGCPISKRNIFCVGDNPKGETVENLVRELGCRKVFFYDDREENCESVVEHCMDLVNNLTIYKFSRTNPGEVDYKREYGKKSESRRMNDWTLRRMRRMAGI